MKSLRITIWIFAAFLAGASSSTGLAEDGASVSNLLQNTFDTSTPAVAAPWSMKPWLWEDDVNTSQAVWDLVDGCRDHDLPLGAIMIDSPWATRYNNFRFDEKRYPDAR
ncbi:MAG TPA: TIM-barrel domain-containing protein, partial [Pirellulales bacterium]|nr:TIM-barrel domain-containing protein [Pirellulales bacterium]